MNADIPILSCELPTVMANRSLLDERFEGVTNCACRLCRSACGEASGLWLWTAERRACVEDMRQEHAPRSREAEDLSGVQSCFK